MKFWLIALICFFSVMPASAQLYSYRNKDGKLVITDRPIRSKKYKLVDTYTPKHIKEKAKEAEAEMTKDILRSKGGKYVLSKKQVASLTYSIAKSYEVDPKLVAAVIEIESSRNVRAKSSKGAMGLMQLIPATAKRFGVKNPWDPRQNVKGGTKYLRYLLTYFEGNVDHVLAAYNAGENAVDRYGGIPPYKETQRYVKKIRKLYTAKTLEYNATATKYRSKLLKNGKKTPRQLARAE